MTATPATALTSERPQSNASARIAAAEIDASCRGPLLLLFVSGMMWLVFGLLLAVISSIKLHAPGFLASTAWLTLGRIHPAAMNAILYGFASQTAIGVLLWMMCRLGGMRLLFQRTISLGTALWNLGVAMGILGILGGGSTGFEWLEMPRYASPILFVSYTLIGICALVTFYLRPEKPLYVSQWYLLAALFWFPWIYSAANLLLVFYPVRGVVQSIVNAWFTGNFLGLWLTPIGLGIIFYFIPKLSGRPLHSYYLAVFGFWTLAFFTNWTGLTKLVGGPVPAWMTSASIAATTLLIVPLLCVAVNWHLTLRGLYPKAKENVTLRFIVFGAASYLIAGVMSIVLGLRTVSAVTHLTYVETAQVQLAVLGFVSMVLLGSLYYIVPRMMQREWPSASTTRIHFKCSAIGIGLIVVALAFAGIIQGSRLNNPEPVMPFIDIVKATVPFVGIATLGQLLLLLGQVALLWNFISLLREYAEPLRKSTVELVLKGGLAKEEVRS